jgi:hypothetical protein
MDSRRLVTVGVALVALAGASPVTWASASVMGRPAMLATAGTISTGAGGVGGPGPATRVSVPASGVASRGGDLFVADGLVQEVSARGRLTTPVGDSSRAGGGGIVSGSPAGSANLDATDVAVAPNGDRVITDTQAERVLVAAVKSGWYSGVKVTAGHIYILAGSGRQGISGNGGSARSAELNNPAGVAVDSAGNVVIADTDNNRVRVVAGQGGTFYGKAM